MNILKQVAEIKAKYLVILYEKHGSTPQKEGAYMLLGKSGKQSGTIGGGLIEHVATSLGAAILSSGLIATAEFTLSNYKAGALGMVCGGKNKLIYIPLTAEVMKELETGTLCFAMPKKQLQIFPKEILAECDEFLDKSDNFTLYQESLNIINPPKLPAKSCYSKGNNYAYFCFKPMQAPRIIIFGGGHVAQKVSYLLSFVGYKQVILEDRLEFLKKELFAKEAELKKVEFSCFKKELTIEKNDFICVLTRGHRSDIEVIDQLLKEEFSFLGVMGSKAKKHHMLDELTKRGYNKEILDKITCPIGLDIGSVSIEEIAVSIVAQIIATYQKNAN